MGRLDAIIGASALAGFLALGGCATPYQDMGLRGGVRAVQITGSIAQVTARGTSATDPDRIERYALRKAAEATIAAGYDHFEVVSAGDRSRTVQGVAGYGASAWHGFPTVGLNVPFVRPGETLLIRMSRGAPADASGAAVFDAGEVLQHLGGRRG